MKKYMVCAIVCGMGEHCVECIHAQWNADSLRLDKQDFEVGPASVRIRGVPLYLFLHYYLMKPYLSNCAIKVYHYWGLSLPSHFKQQVLEV